MTPEFSRRVALDTIGREPREVSIEATVEERIALARRFDLDALDALHAKVTLTASARGIEAQGRLIAAVVQACVVTADPVPATIDQPVTLRFVDPEVLASAQEEVELHEDDCDTVPHEGGAVDVGEGVAQTLGLALDPFPRSAGAPAEGASVWRAGPDEGAFAGLKGLLGGSP